MQLSRCECSVLCLERGREGGVGQEREGGEREGWDKSGRGGTKVEHENTVCVKERRKDVASLTVSPAASVPALLEHRL
jgi:hypothetical protein